MPKPAKAEDFCRHCKGRHFFDCYDDFVRVTWHNRRPVVDILGRVTGECVWRCPHTGDIGTAHEYAEVMEDGFPALAGGIGAKLASVVVTRRTAVEIRDAIEDAKNRENQS